MEAFDVAPPEGGEPVSEDDRRIEGYHKALHSLFKGEEDILVARSIASFMGCHMAHTEKWQSVIPGFVRETIEYANIAMAAHRMAEHITTPEKPNASTEEAKE